MAGAGDYCFDYIASFLFLHQYISLTNDTAFLLRPIPSAYNASAPPRTPLDFLRRIAWAWRDYPKAEASPYLADYGPNKRSFLEAVPTYHSVVPALQYANAGMLYSLARLLETGITKSSHLSRPLLDSIQQEIVDLRGNASAIVRDATALQYVASTGEGGGGQGGYFKVLFNSSSVEVRAISDFLYTAASLGLLGRELPEALNAEMRREMVVFFNSELLCECGWVRALSLSDAVMANVSCTLAEGPRHCGTEDLLAMRADW